MSSQMSARMENSSQNVPEAVPASHSLRSVHPDMKGMEVQSVVMLSAVMLAACVNDSQDAAPGLS